jgi:hypothetical protein
VNTIICTDAERDLILTGARHLVVPGDRVRDLALDAYLTPDSAPIPGFKIVAPQRWVGATGPCRYRMENAECRGGVLYGMDRGYPLGKCPDCVDGRKRVALVVTCPDDGTVALLTERERHQPRRPFIQATKCSTCSGTGRVVFAHATACSGTGSVVFAHATVEVLPVVGDGYIVPGEDYVEAVDGGEVMLWRLLNPSDPEAHTSTFLFDAPGIQPVPGRDWVVALDNVELAQ